MKNTTFSLFVLLSFVFSHTTYAQAPNWQWAKSLGGTNSAGTKSITLDKDGNILIAGYVETASGTSAPQSLTKFDPNGNKLWSTLMADNADLIPKSIAVDQQGNIAVSGYFKSSSITFGSNTFTNKGEWDLFLAKYTPEGNLLWATTAGGNRHDDGLSIAFDSDGNLILSGYFQSSSISFSGNILVNAGAGASSTDLFLAKFDGNGTLQWVKSAGGLSYESIIDVSIDAEDNIIAFGDFSSPAISIGNTTLTNTSNDKDIFLAKFDTNGNIMWVNKPNGLITEACSAVALDGDGNIYITGRFYSFTLEFGSISINNAGAYDLYLAKYNANGVIQWAKSAGGIKNENAIGITTDPSGNVLLCGEFESPSISFGATTLTSNGVGDMFLAKINPNGSIIWAKQAGGSSYDAGRGVITNESGDIYMVGDYLSPTIEFETTTLTKTGTVDAFLAKIGATTDVTDTSNPEITNLYPNPTTGLCYLYIPPSEEPTALEVYDMLGRLRLSQKEPLLNWNIDLTTFEDGVYLVMLKAGSKLVWTEKLVKRK